MMVPWVVVMYAFDVLLRCSLLLCIVYCVHGMCPLSVVMY